MFVARPNRFIAVVKIGCIETLCHVKNTGRLGELLIPGVEVIVQKPAPERKARKTGYDLVAAVTNGEEIINIDSQAPNRLFEEWVRAGKSPIAAAEIRREYVYGDSRLDFLITDASGKRHLIETKGVTLLDGGAALFPDAPTERGIKHLRELCLAVEAGFSAYAVFIIQMEGVDYFTPNAKMHKAFYDALCMARDAGVQVLAFDCAVGEDSLAVKEPVSVLL